MSEAEVARAALGAIIDGVAARGAHATRWGALRAACFPGTSGWSRLQDWCAAHDLECRMCYSHTSKRADVQFARTGSIRP